jgi:hypothetical protein
LSRDARTHPALRTETTRPPDLHSLQQQRKFDEFPEEFYNERPQEALDMKCPAEVSTSATRHYHGLPELSYPFHHRTIHVTCCGRICLHRKNIYLSTVLAGQAVGIKEIEEDNWLVSFMEYDRGYNNLEEKTLQPLDNPFGAKVLPMSPVRSVTYVSEPDLTHVSGLDQIKLVDVRGFEPLTPCLQSVTTKSILLVRLALFCVLVPDFAANLAATGPKLDPSTAAERGFRT